MRQAEDPDEVAAYRMLEHALRAPFYTLLKNAGYDPGEKWLRKCPAQTRAWALTFAVVNSFNMLDAGIIDPALVVKEACAVPLQGRAYC
jgi:chaperonin GroEL (HSP60 family)